MQSLSSILASSPAQINQVLLIVAVLAVIWIVLRFVLKLAVRVMVSGCVVILIVGLILLATTYFR